MFIKLGDVIDGCMLVQFAPWKGILIHLASGNRYNDEPIKLVRENGGAFGEVGCDISSLPKSLVDGKHVRSAVSISPIEKPKEDLISFIRYVRPKAPENYMRLDSKRGVTFLLQLDYIQRVVKFQYSICNGDNFSKEVGIQMAIDRSERMGGYYQLPLPNDGIPESGTVEFIVQEIARNWRHMMGLEFPVTKQTLSIPKKDMELIIEFFSRS